MTRDKPTRCALCSQEAVGIWYMPQGCIAHPDLTVQPLCHHHWLRAQPLGGMELLRSLIVGPVERHAWRAEARAEARAELTGLVRRLDAEARP